MPYKPQTNTKPSLLKSIALLTALGLTSYIFYIISSELKKELSTQQTYTQHYK